MDSTQAALFTLVALVMGWFAAGVVGNIRRGNAVLKWMQAGLPRIGERTMLRWLGSSVVELKIAKAKPPFRQMELLVVMEPRDVPWFWLMARAQGRRDLVILRGNLQSAPRLEFDVVSPTSWTGRSALEKGAKERWETSEMSGMRFLAPRASAPVSQGAAPAALELARRVHPVVWRLAVRRDYPQMELHVPLPDYRRGDAVAYFEAVRALARSLSGAE